MDWSPTHSAASGSTDHPVVADSPAIVHIHDSPVVADSPSIIQLSESPIDAQISNRYVMATSVCFSPADRACFFV